MLKTQDSFPLHCFQGSDLQCTILLSIIFRHFSDPNGEEHMYGKVEKKGR